jgi:GGDEF domain-containing protein
LLLLLPALAVLHWLPSSGATGVEVLLLAVLAVCLLAWSTSALRRLCQLNPRIEPCQGVASHLRIVSAKGVLIAAKGMLEQAVADGRPLSIAVLELHDLPELQKLFGSGMAARVLTRASKKLRAVAGAKGLAMRTSRTQFTLVLPGLEADSVRLALRTVFGAACCIEDDAAEEIVLLPDFAVETLTSANASIAQSYDRLCDNLAAEQRHAKRPTPGAPRRAAPSSDPLPQSSARQHLVAPVHVPTVPMPLR